jgi:hypothetical protein
MRTKRRETQDQALPPSVTGGGTRRTQQESLVRRDQCGRAKVGGKSPGEPRYCLQVPLCELCPWKAEKGLPEEDRERVARKKPQGCGPWKSRKENLSLW